MRNNRIHPGLLLIILLFCSQCQDSPADQMEKEPEVSIINNTFCNPMDLSYRFQLDGASRREAADPTVVWFRDRYFLFASKSGGYWHSQDLINWEFLQTDEIPTEEYAPTAIELNDTLYFLASSRKKSTIYKSTDPLAGKWEVVRDELDEPVWDPAFYMDEDNRLYLYWGCHNLKPIYGVELDFENNFTFIGERQEVIDQNIAIKGWERRGDFSNRPNERAFIEGAWMNKAFGKYYLQYSAPGTEFKSYNDGVYVADSPLGPYKLQAHNPFAYKPAGFACGAGHGSTFTDPHGNYWHVGTITISQKHIFERRLGLFPAFFDADSTFYSVTKYGDYPYQMPNKSITSFADIFPGWMLLSYQKPVEVSSGLDSFPATQMVDEEIRTYWAAASGERGEFVIIDLEEVATVHAIQLNFAEHNTSLFGRVSGKPHRFVLEYSNDKVNWEVLEDQSENNTDNTHVYLELPEKVESRYFKITNVAVPDGHFAISGFRLFGKGKGRKPEKVASLIAKRNTEDKAQVRLEWDKSGNATGYVISYGNAPDKLYQTYMIYGDNAVTINTLNVALDYHFTIEAFNENGITESEILVKVE